MDLDNLKEMLRETLTALFMAQNAKEIREALLQLQQFFKAIGIPKVKDANINTKIGWIYINGSTEIAFDIPSEQHIEKYWLSKEYANLCFAFAEIFEVIESIIEYKNELRNIVVEVPEIMITARALEEFEPEEIKQIVTESPLETYNRFLNFIEKINSETKCPYIKIDGKYVIIRIHGVEHTLFKLPSVKYAPQRINISIEICDEETFYFVPEL